AKQGGFYAQSVDMARFLHGCAVGDGPAAVERPPQLGKDVTGWTGLVNRRWIGPAGELVNRDSKGSRQLLKHGHRVDTSRPTLDLGNPTRRPVQAKREPLLREATHLAEDGHPLA